MPELRESFIIRNLARDPSSKVMRKLRPGNYTGFMFSDGRRIRRAGARGTEVTFKDALRELDRIIEGVELREIEVIAPDNTVATAEQLKSWGKAMGHHRQALLDDDPDNDPDTGDLAPPGGDPSLPQDQPPAQPPPPMEPTFSVMLLGVAAEDKIKVIREVRQMTGLDLGDVKTLVEGTPKQISKGLSKNDAMVLLDALQKAGAMAELVEEKPVEVQDTKVERPATPPPPPEPKKPSSKKGGR
jgi:hypothetical protein